MNKRFLALSLLLAFLFSPLVAGAGEADGGTVVRLWTDNVLGKEAGGKEKSTTAKKGDGTLIKLTNMKATAECSFSRRERKAAENDMVCNVAVLLRGASGQRWLSVTFPFSHERAVRVLQLTTSETRLRARFKVAPSRTQ